MRAIPGAVETLLKSRAQAGTNAHNHLITLTGAPSGLGDPTWATYKTLRGAASSTYGGGSFVKLSTGRRLVTYQKVNGTNIDIYLSYVDTEADIFFADNESSDEEWVFDTITHSGDARRQSTLKKLANGDLLLFVYAASFTPYGDMVISVYKSANGLGTDFTLLSEAYRFQLQVDGAVFQAGACCIGHVLQLASGRILIPFVGYKHESWYEVMVSKCAYSDDDGETWTVSDIYSSNYGLELMGFGKVGEQLMCVRSQYAGGGSTGFAVSDDWGETWSLLDAHTNGHNGDMMNSQLFWGEADGYTYFVYRVYPGIVIFRRLDSLPLSNTGQEPYNMDEWELVYGEDLGVGAEVLWTTEDGNLAFGGSKTNTTPEPVQAEARILGGIRTAATLRAKRIEINRNKGMASSATVVFDNKGGIYSPDKAVGVAWKNVMFPNNGILIDQGYGTELIRTFSGTIDDVVMTTFPAEITLVCRDYLKRAYDQLITSGGVHTITYANFTPEAMFTALAGLAGWAAGDIHTEVTGLTIAKKIFTNETYGDAFSWLADMCGFMVFCDEDGDIYYVKDDDDAVPSSDYAFAEGEDIISLGYTISDRDLYNKIIVIGDGVSWETTYYNTYSILAQKKMIINASEATTEAQCQAIAEQARYVMNSRARICEFAAIANPYIQIKDTLTVTETTTLISELYNITDISTVQSPDGYIAQITCYHYAAPAES